MDIPMGRPHDVVKTGEFPKVNFCIGDVNLKRDKWSTYAANSIAVSSRKAQRGVGVGVA